MSALRHASAPPLGFDWDRIRDDDLEFPRRYLGPSWTHRRPDLIICYDDGAPYLYRWHVIERNRQANTYFHIQVASDPERPLHDHPWDNQSVILAGDGYIELVQSKPPLGPVESIKRVPGDVVHRPAKQAHRLLLPVGNPRLGGSAGYTMTQFTTGPAIKDWGFWIGDRWYGHGQIVQTDADGRSFFNYPPGTSKEDYHDTH